MLRLGRVVGLVSVVVIAALMARIVLGVPGADEADRRMRGVRARHSGTGATLRCGQQLVHALVGGCQPLRLAERREGSRGVALLEQRLGLERERRDGRVIELERDAHLGEHLVVALERQQRGSEHDATFDRRRPAEEPQPADLDGLVILTRGDQSLAAANEVALRHCPEGMLRHPGAHRERVGASSPVTR